MLNQPAGPTLLGFDVTTVGTLLSVIAALAVFVDDRPASAWFRRGAAMVLFDFDVVDGMVARITFRADQDVLGRVVRREKNEHRA